MQAELVKLTSKGQLTLPKEYRDKLRLEKGSHLSVSVKGDTLMLKKVYEVAPLSENDPIWDMVGIFEDRRRADAVAMEYDHRVADGELG
ncbi:AbrB/MazE/SpoVT family DNA-binding domain-containing protein [Desulfoscipio gibsoniae]|uniref:Looped-hinge helix DNA binding domain, AbrB family n=1 Tax=Desulfoscipio gibsoniae DSM 7213 TaxID=767817 RepID=R4KSK8_9FIRM|nr:AbrB/MazE/SpoVT family DNA-binding domain-containing protein [Desulfoscipio gibsoniae]AGL03560.1 looped-hinge helix DNA binding domain, AbrB family [Desulfoscipio gibsoniae DSM 7213]